jgi:hypothetical protein
VRLTPLQSSPTTPEKLAKGDRVSFPKRLGGRLLHSRPQILCLGDFSEQGRVPEEQVTRRGSGQDLVAVGAEEQLLQSKPIVRQTDQLLPGRHIPQLDRFVAVTRRGQAPAIGGKGSDFLIPPRKLVCQQIGDETMLTGHLVFPHNLRGGVPHRWVRKELTQIPRDQEV